MNTPELTVAELAQLILDRAEAGLNLDDAWGHADRLAHTMAALEEIITLCQEQLPKGGE